MERKLLPIDLNYNDFSIIFGKAKISAFTRLKGVKSSYHLINEILHGKGIICKDPKRLYKEFTQDIGITPKAAIKMINNLGWKVIVGDFTSSQVFKYCYPRGYKRQLNQTLVGNLHSMKDVVKQALSDGQENLLPLVLKLGMSPKEIKDSVSRATWKHLTKVSFTKAQYIGRALSRDRVCSIDYYLGLNLSYMANIENFDKSLPHHTINRLAREERCLTDTGRVYDITRVVEDTMMLAEEVGYKTNPNWSWKRWQEEHKIVTRKHRAREFSDEEITKGVYQHLLPHVTSKYGDKATLLTTPLTIAMEGDQMGHCVAGYARDCLQGSYVVYHLELRDGTVGTLGCYVLPTVTGGYQLNFQQCYGKYNDRISTEFAREVIKLNNNNLLDTGK
jgi:hypothetical protein